MNMKRISICAPQRNRKRLLETLQSMGVVELEFTDADYGETMDTSAKRSVFLRNVQTIEEALAVLDLYAPPDASMLDSLKGRNVIGREDYEKAAAESRKIVEDARSILKLRDELEEYKADISRIDAAREALVPWMEADIPLAGSGTKHCDVTFGVAAKSVDDDTLSELLSPFAADMKVVSEDKTHRYLMVITKKEDTQTVLDVLRKNGFSLAPKGGDLLPKEEDAALLRKRSDNESSIEKRKEGIAAFAPKRDLLQRGADYYAVRADKYEVLGKILQSKHTFFLAGYVPERYAESVERICLDNFDAAVEVTDAEDAPVMLENNGFSESFEGVLESFGLPKKGELDPSVVMSFFYVFLFGLMLSDAAYGAIISIACGIMLKVFRNMESSLRKSIKMFMFCGISTFVWGVLFGGYFGDAVEVISRTFFGKEVSIPPLWFAPLWNPMRLLLYSMLFGLIHLFTGLGIKGYLYLRDKDIVGFISDVLSWFMLLAGLLLLLLNSSIYASLSGAALPLGTVGKRMAIGLAIAGALIILVMAGRSSKNVGKRLLKGAYSLYDITSWLSDVLSYSRLLALGLATGVIASVINQMGAMGGKSVLGTVVFIIVFIVGHLFNLGINILGAYVHTNRLQYVEFFGKFYEGGGRKFQPFSEKTKHIKIQK